MANKSLNNILSRLKQKQRTKGSWMIGKTDNVLYSYRNRGKMWRVLKVILFQHIQYEKKRWSAVAGGATLQMNINVIPKQTVQYVNINVNVTSSGIM